MLKRNELVLREMEGLQAEKRREILEQEKERLAEIDLLFEEEVERWRKQCAERLDTIDSDLLRESEAHARTYGLPGGDSSAGSCSTDVSLPAVPLGASALMRGTSTLPPLNESTTTSSSSRDDTLASGSTTHYAVADIGAQQRAAPSPLRPSPSESLALGLSSPARDPLARQSHQAPPLPSGSPLKRGTLDGASNLSFRQSTQMYFPSARTDAAGSHASAAANRTSTLPSSISADNISQSGSRPTPHATKTK